MTENALTGFFGWMGWKAREDDGSVVLESMGSELESRALATTNCRQDAGSALGFAGPGAISAHLAGSEWMAVVQGTPRFECETLRRVAAQEGNAAAAVRGLQESGPSFVSHLKGAFCLAAVAPARRTGVLAVDRIGGRFPISYRISGEAVVFSTRGSAILRHPAGVSSVDHQGIFDYIYFHVVPAPRTGWRDIQRLLPGQMLYFENGNVRLETYWRPVYEDDARASLQDLEREFQERLTSSVASEMDDHRVGCFLSGGTDSSTVAGLATKLSGQPANTYSIGFDAQGYDELRYARIASAHFGTRHRKYDLKPDDVADFLGRIAQSYSSPFGNESAVSVYYCAKMAREDGIVRMLGGDGGDELFAGNERYAKQKIFDAYDTIPPFLRANLIEPWVLGLPDIQTIPVFRKLHSYVKQAKTPMPERSQAYSYVDRLGVSRIFEPGFLEQVDVEEPITMLRDAYNASAADALVNKMLAMDLRFTLADNDLPKVSRMCEVAGVEASYPLLSDEMVEFSLRVPVRYKLKGLRLRWFWKHALRKFLPRQILRKRKHGMGLPFGIWLKADSRLRELCTDCLQRLKSRGIVRGEFIDELTRLHHEEHQTYYGVMIWMLVQLELWFRARSSSDST